MSTGWCLNHYSQGDSCGCAPIERVDHWMPIVMLCRIVQVVCEQGIGMFDQVFITVAGQTMVCCDIAQAFLVTVFDVLLLF